jgi:cytochrome c biogenesis protein CcdA
MLPVLSPEALPAILLVFSIGVIIPFILIGLLAGSISKLARTTYKNRNRIRLISGLILIGYAAYILIFHLI